MLNCEYQKLNTKRVISTSEFVIFNFLEFAKPYVISLHT